MDAPVRDILPNFRQANAKVKDEATILDFMSHRTGLASKNMLWLHDFAGVDLRRNETLRTVSYLESVYGFRAQWLYSNWGYTIADQIIERLSEQTWVTFLSDRVLKPLGIERTLTEHSSNTGNVAQV